jgi:hypothetical protein
MGLSADVAKVEAVAKTVETKVEGVVQLAELTYTQARGPFLIGAGAGVAACVVVLLVLHFIVKVL